MAVTRFGLVMPYMLDGKKKDASSAFAPYQTAYLFICLFNC